MSTDIPLGQRMSEEEVLAQVPTFLAAGHETTRQVPLLSMLLTFKLTEVQQQLRAELSSVPTDSPSMDQLNALPFLDTVIREVLRILSPIQSTVRIAMKDDVIPLSQPFVDRYGKQHDHLEVKKGQPIVVPILAINKDKSLWGEDAEDFKYVLARTLGRATRGSELHTGRMGQYDDFSGGPARVYRVALYDSRVKVQVHPRLDIPDNNSFDITIRTKALIFTLIREFEFELAVPEVDILIKRGFPAHRPQVRGKKGDRMPLVISLSPKV
ncbi:hypothetical protein AAF712_007901 [Marasmius tenuissimus]|uniref:Uncharacterized protein n=1 Tax=Marasmius tenuissimus TaxID=585030 RepID=A0ABR2ZUR7_9AGAR